MVTLQHGNRHHEYQSTRTVKRKIRSPQEAGVDEPFVTYRTIGDLQYPSKYGKKTKRKKYG
jgi:hypothetical protein